MDYRKTLVIHFDTAKFWYRSITTNLLEIRGKHILENRVVSPLSSPQLFNDLFKQIFVFFILHLSSARLHSLRYTYVLDSMKIYTGGIITTWCMYSA